MDIHSNSPIHYYGFKIFLSLSYYFRGPKVPIARDKAVTLSHEPKEAELTEQVASQLEELANQLEEGYVEL